ncbi:MAG: aldo/keto reductase family protein [Sulfobacillus thermotolerans]|uniref:Voltage-gated potassium channel n=1 Tax=Sulfobacillus thermotolerans TaxID=338644 RepID=A0ABM6RTK5_9FIRM|nr:voltage-gated potassium channel [Sulfobacillus thermotolerans]MCY0908999.1 aldo/keto reductase family protein [Sulfobacillus thermotolerans]
MNYRRLGKAGIKVSEIALGSWLTYGTVTEQKTAEACIHHAYDLGINHFDCANVYGSAPHEAERFLAQALAPYARDSYVLTTKAFWPVGPGVNDRGLSRKHLIAQLDQSLTALGTDYVDIFYCHRYDPDTEMEEILSTIDDQVRAGKIRYGGISEWPAERIAEAVSVQNAMGLHPLRASQPVYNMFSRYIEQAVLPICEQNGMGVVVFSPLAQGLLTGKYRLGQATPEGSRAATKEVSHFITRYLTEEHLTKIEALMGVAQELGLTLSQLALAWVLRQPGISSALIGASRPEQITENVKAVGVQLAPETLDRIEQILQ